MMLALPLVIFPLIGLCWSADVSSCAHGSCNVSASNTNLLQTRRLLQSVAGVPGTGTDRPEDQVVMLTGCNTESGSDLSKGNVLPQLKRPWGFNDWVPQTRYGDSAWWFNREDKNFHGIRCTHQPSPWIGDYAYLVVQPHTESSMPVLQYDSSSSIFRPYLVSTQLRDTDGVINFEVTATSRAALFRMAFDHESNPSREVSVRIDEGDVEVSDGTIRGVVRTSSHQLPPTWRGMFFVMKPHLSAETSFTAKAQGSTATLQFPAGRDYVTFAVATSFISHEQAERNLRRELGSKSFEEVVEEGRQEWRSSLGRIKVDTTDSNQLQIFYTNLWRSQLFPRELYEVDANGQEVHLNNYNGLVRPGRIVSDSGFWDAYKTVYNLQSIIAPERMGRLIDGWVGAADDAGWLPQWPSPNQVNSMVGTMGDVVLADAIVKSKWGLLSGFDTEKAYETIRRDAFNPQTVESFGRKALGDYIEKGYVPEDMHDESVALSMGYYLADASISNAATVLGKTEDAQELRARSRRYRELFDSGTQFFRRKMRDGAFDPDFDPLVWKTGFTEANAYHYRFDVPHDVEGLVSLYGGNFCKAVKDMLTFTGEAYRVGGIGGYGEVIHEMLEAERTEEKGFGLYAHNNQPSHNVLWIAKKAGCNEVADKYLRKVVQSLYTLDGWSGDEDNGEMGAWYVLAAIGIYQLEGGRDEVVLGSPSVVQAVVQLPNGELTISTVNQSADNVHVQKVVWESAEGEERTVSNNVLKFTDLMQGGRLTFTLGSTPVAPVGV